MISVVMAAALWAHSALADDPGGNSLFETCVDRGGDHEACHCVALEAHSRFTADELEVVVIAADPELSSDERAERLRQHGANPADLSSITRRLVAAEPVIHQACGAGILRMQGE